MSDEELDELFRNAIDNIEIEFEPSSWDKLKVCLSKVEISDDIQQSEQKQFLKNQS